MISAYTFVIGAKQRRYPLEASIKSALSIADEFCIVYDSRFDDPGLLAGVDERVQLIPVTIDFLEWDFINKLLTAARRACSGDWCLQPDVDMVFDDKALHTIPKAIERADDINADAIHVCTVSPVQDLVKPMPSSRQILTRNAPYIYHKTASYMITYIDSEIWGGKCIGVPGFDDFSLYDERTDAHFKDGLSEFVDIGFEQYNPLTKKEIERKVQLYTHVWHYSFFNPGRKHAQGRQTAEWQDRTFGRANALNVSKLIGNLQQTVVVDPSASQASYRHFLDSGWVQVDLDHPALAQSWVDSMGLEAT